jgi:hypothetical protein
MNPEYLGLTAMDAISRDPDDQTTIFDSVLNALGCRRTHRRPRSADRATREPRVSHAAPWAIDDPPAWCLAEGDTEIDHSEEINTNRELAAMAAKGAK